MFGITRKEVNGNATVVSEMYTATDRIKRTIKTERTTSNKCISFICLLSLLKVQPSNQSCPHCGMPLINSLIASSTSTTNSSNDITLNDSMDHQYSEMITDLKSMLKSPNNTSSENEASSLTNS